MKRTFLHWLSLFLRICSCSGPLAPVHGQELPFLAGLAVRDVTPEGPIWLAGYAGRNKPSEGVDGHLVVQALALQDRAGEKMAFIALDNCEVSRAFAAPVYGMIKELHGLDKGRILIVSSHTHSAPVLDETIIAMYQMPEAELEKVKKYSQFLKEKLVEVVGAALADLKPARLSYGNGRARFAMNRRVYKESSVDFGENYDGPIDWDVPVMKIAGLDGALRAILFGYACHGTTIAGEEFYVVSADFMGYARQHLEALYPGASALYVTGMGADSNPSARGRLVDAKRHGLELAGAVAGVLNRPLQAVDGPIRFAFDELDLPLNDPPARERLEADRKSGDYHIRTRAQAYLKLLEDGKPLPAAVKLPLSVVRLGDDLTFVAMAGEVVVDYAIRLKRLLGGGNPWMIGYAYEVPCYIPSMRLLKEGGYEADSSLIYYGIYGPFRGRIEDQIVNRVVELARGLKTH
ncbi:MAG: neutral/alkaline non-lysosomal ceramidase N-terminal domain-containing protein [Planctomycetes bacterium]|nr:neutral/alkaline non-lysosomal ceramidase N-terminal domain-containing protein [Planctomycetota bacterium]